MESDSSDDSQSDSGVSADFCSSSESNSNVSNGSVSNETPIEREIRRTVEREKSLRRSRGLPNLPSSPEYVDIPLRKTSVCQSLSTKSERKDRELAGKKMQLEIHEETQREQVLVRLGKVPGFYDNGTLGQLEHRKQVFEAFQKPSESSFTVSTTSKTASSSSDTSSSSGGSTIEDQERRPSVDLLSPAKISYVTRGERPSSFSRGTGERFIIHGNNLTTGPTQQRHRLRQHTTVDSSSRINRTLGKEEEEEEKEAKENPFFKLRSSMNVVKVEQDIREAQERDKELHRQRISLYGGEGVSSSSSVKGLAVLDSPGRETGPSAAQRSPGKNMWIPAQAEEKRTVLQESRRSARIPRQKKNPLVERWESGLIHDNNREDD